jgi:hypothetical protein
MTALLAALLHTLSTYFPLGKNRLLSLATLIAGLAQSRTVNLSQIACRHRKLMRPVHCSAA